MSRKIGGFFGLHMAHAPAQTTLVTLWGLNIYSNWTFANGRSALHYLLRYLTPKRVWLPAYCCISLAEATQGFDLQYYPITDTLSPDCDFLKTHLKDGDAVVAIDYFGRNPDAAFLEYCKTRSDIHWIEDRAQALLPAVQPWGDYMLYSPRKLLGVADGGIVVGIKTSLSDITYESAIEPDATHPAIMRAADKEESNNAAWYAAYVATEEAMNISPQTMSQTSKKILDRADAAAISTQRKANYMTLMQALSDIALLPKDATDFVPFGFPIRIPERKMLAALLHKNNIFAAHHWPELPSPASFTNEHKLADLILTLPCDHRYDTRDMQRVIRVVKGAL